MAAPKLPPTLLITADSTVRQQLAETLRQSGFVVAEAGNGAEALAAQQRCGSNIVILLAPITEADAAELSLQLRQQQPGLRIVTAFDDAEWADYNLKAPLQIAPLLLTMRILHGEQSKAQPALQAEAATLATIAHDLRNALAPLRSAIAIMARSGNDEPTRKPVLAMMEKQVGQMVELINQLSAEARRLEGPAAAQPLAETPQPPITTGGSTSSHATRRRVLVADDSVAVQDAVSALLRSQGYEVRTAADGLEALETVGDWQPDFIFVDMRMPRLDGFGLARRLRADYPERTMKIILMSGLALDSVLLRHARAAGFDECIDKVAPPEQWFVHLQGG